MTNALIDKLLASFEVGHEDDTAEKAHSFVNMAENAFLYHRTDRSRGCTVIGENGDFLQVATIQLSFLFHYMSPC
jgi:hypothetical protein